MTMRLPTVSPALFLALLSCSVAPGEERVIPLANTGFSLDRLAASLFETAGGSPGIILIFSAGLALVLCALALTIRRWHQMEAEIQDTRLRLDELQEKVTRSAVILLRCGPEDGWPIEEISAGIQIYGYSPETLERERIRLHDLIFPEDLKRIKGEALRCISRQECSHFSREYRLLTTTGEPRWVDERIWVKRRADGTILCFQCALYDIHERRTAEQKLRDYRSHLEEIIQSRTSELLSSTRRLTCEIAERKQAEERLQFLVQFQQFITSISSSFINLDADAQDTAVEDLLAGSLLDLSNLLHLERCSLYLHHHEEDCFRQAYEWHHKTVPALSPEKCIISAQAIPSWLRKLIKLDPVQFCLGGELSEIQREVIRFTELPDIRFLGAIPLIFRRRLYGFFLLSSTRQTTEWNDETLVLLQILGEIFVGALEHKFTEQALIRSERMAAVGTLSSGVAHEFNNINTAILGYSEICMEMLPADHECHDFLTHVYNSAIRARDLTRNLLTFSGQEMGDYGHHSLRQVAEETLALVERQFAAEGIHLLRQLNEVPETQMDAGQIGQVILNLLINASHALIGRTDRSITIESGHDEGKVWLRVRDNGCGIPAKNLKRIFTPFFSTKGEHGDSGSTMSTVKGTGLGLSISHTIITKHNATLDVESAENRGATFTLTLPVRSRAEQVTEPESAEPEDSPDLHASILILDDEEDVRNLLTLCLRLLNCEVYASDDGEELLKRLREKPVDLVLVDLKMPRMNGIVFIEALKKLELTNPPAVIVCTGADLSSERKHLLDLGVIEIIIKPFDIDILASRVRAILQERKR